MFSWAICLPSLLGQRPIQAASPALIVYLDLFLAQVHLDGFLVPGDPLSDTDLLFEPDLLGDNDLLLEDLHDHLVLADIRHGSCAGFPGLTDYRHPLDDYLLASLRDPYYLTLRSHALFDVHLTGFALADAGSEFLLRALHPQVFLEDNALLGDRPYRVVVRRLFTASLISQSGPFWAGSLCSERPKQGDTPHKRTRPPKVCPYRPVPLPRTVASSTSISSRLTSSSTTSVSSTTSLRRRISSLATVRLSTTTSSSVRGTDTSSSPIWASDASPSTGTRSTVTSSCLVGTSICSRSVLTRFRTFMAPASRSRVPPLSSSSERCTLSSSSSSRSLPGWLRPSWLRSCSRNSPVSVSPMLMPEPTVPAVVESVVPAPLCPLSVPRPSVPISQS